MFDLKNVDISEEDILQFDKELLDILLVDRTTGKNIIWATDDYKSRAEKGYGKNDFIEIENITGINKDVIRPRSVKSLELQKSRAREKAEVFTPSWLCNKQNNLADQSFFGKENVFNNETTKGWQVNEEKILFPEGKTWKDYIMNPILEITCGEAPYLVSRYDSTTGKKIPINERIGLIDRKFRILNENATNDSEWVEWAIKAMQHSYGFELQGDNLLMARENILFTFLDYYSQRFTMMPPKDLTMQIADIISWNIWQMDGLKLVVPFSCHDVLQQENPSLFADFSDSEPKILPCEGCQKGQLDCHNGQYCKIKDWDSGNIDTFLNITKN